MDITIGILLRKGGIRGTGVRYGEHENRRCKHRGGGEEMMGTVRKILHSVIAPF